MLAHDHDQLFQITLGKVEGHRAIVTVWAPDSNTAADMVEDGMKSGAIRPAWAFDRNMAPKGQVFQARVDPVDADDDLASILGRLAHTGMSLTIDALRAMDDREIDRLLAMEREEGIRISIVDLDREALDFAWARMQATNGTGGFTDLAMLVELFDQDPRWRSDMYGHVQQIRIGRPWSSADAMSAARQGWRIEHGIIMLETVANPSRALRGAADTRGAFDRILHLATDQGSPFHRRALLEVGNQLGLRQDLYGGRTRPQPGLVLSGMATLMQQAGLQAVVSLTHVSTELGHEFQVIGSGGPAQAEAKVLDRFASTMAAIGAPIVLEPSTADPRRLRITFLDPAGSRGHESGPAENQAAAARAALSPTP